MAKTCIRSLGKWRAIHANLLVLNTAEKSVEQMAREIDLRIKKITK